MRALITSPWPSTTRRTLSRPFSTSVTNGARIDYSLERQPLGTMGPLRLIPDLPENFLVMNGDVLTDLDFDLFFNHHLARGNQFTISACSRDIRSEFGVLELNGDDTLHGFREKPVVQYNVSMGIYMANQAILEFIQKDTMYGFDNLMLDMMAAGRPVHVRKHDGYWLDIGRPDDYIQAIDMFETNGAQFLPMSEHHVAHSAV